MPIYDEIYLFSRNLYTKSGSSTRETCLSRIKFAVILYESPPGFDEIYSIQIKSTYVQITYYAAKALISSN